MWYHDTNTALECMDGSIESSHLSGNKVSEFKKEFALATLETLYVLALLIQRGRDGSWCGDGAVVNRRRFLAFGVDGPSLVLVRSHTQGVVQRQLEQVRRVLARPHHSVRTPSFSLWSIYASALRRSPASRASELTIARMCATD